MLNASYDLQSLVADDNYSANYHTEELLTAQNISKIQKLLKLSRACDLSISELAMGWCNKNTNITSRLIDINKPSELKSVAELSNVTLSSDILEDINNII